KYALALGAEALGKIRVADLDRSREELLARLELAGEKYLTVDGGALRAARCERGKESLRLLPIALASLRKDGGGPCRLRCWKERAVRHLAFDPFDRIISVHAERAAKCIDGRVNAAAVVDPGAHGIAFADCFANHVLEGLVGDGRNGGCERAAERAIRRQ